MTEHSASEATSLHTTFGATLRRLADTEADSGRARQLALLAAQLEVAFDQQGSNVQVALWEVQDATRAKIDDLHAHQADTNTLLSGVIDALHALRSDVQVSAAESAARLGELSARISTIDARDLQQYQESAQDRAQLHARLSAVEAIIDARPVLREQERRELVDEIMTRLGHGDR